MAGSFVCMYRLLVWRARLSGPFHKFRSLDHVCFVLSRAGHPSSLSRLAGPPWRALVILQSERILCGVRASRRSSCVNCESCQWRQASFSSTWSLSFHFGGPTLAGLSEILFSRCLFVYISSIWRARLGGLLLLRESFEVGGPALAGRPDFFAMHWFSVSSFFPE